MESISNVQLSLSEYEALKSQISTLEKENAQLKAERNQLCEENKVRIIHKNCIIEKPILQWRPDMCSQVTEVRDELVNFEDIEELVKKDIKERLSEDLNKANDELEKLNDELEELTERLKDTSKNCSYWFHKYTKLLHRNLWQRIINKTE